MDADRTERLAKLKKTKPRGRPRARLSDLNELAAYLHVSRRTVYRLIDTKGLPHMRVGYVLRFDLAEVLAWVHRFTESGDRLEWQDDYPDMKRGDRRAIRPARTPT